MASKKTPNKQKTAEQIIKKICKDESLPEGYCEKTINYIKHIKDIIETSTVDFQERVLDITYSPDQKYIGLFFQHPTYEDMIELFIHGEEMEECLSWEFNNQYGFISNPSDIDIIERLVMVCLAKDLEKDMTHTKQIHNQTNRTLN